MNILPKKRWHVRNQDNKERVRRDEENARQEQKREEERIALAEQEARLALLRKKTGEKAVAVAKSENHHFSLFAAEEEAGKVAKKDNKEYIKEKQAEKEKFEKNIGLLTYVGQSSAEAKGKDEQPWYIEKKAIKKSNDSSDSEKDESKKSRLDPLFEVHKHLKKKKERKKKKKKKEKDRDCSPKRIKSSSKCSIEELREKRLQREKVEREKANKLLRNDARPNETKSKPECDPSRYSNQFFPDLARKRKHERF